MHFCFAGSLKAYYAMGISHDEAVNVIVRNYMGLPTPLILLNHGNRHIYNIKHFMYFLILDRVDYAMLKVICHDHVDSEDYLYEIFIRKAVLNKFRQLNGYKTGKYVKLWYDGAEDNVYASQIHIDLDKPLSIFLEDIAKVYTELTGNPAITSR